MENILQSIQRRWIGRSKREAQVKLERIPNAAQEGLLEIPAFDIEPHDPIMAYFLSIPEAVEVDKLNLNLPALKALQARGVKMVVPLVSQGELVGLLMLGPRQSDQEYSTDDRVLLNTLAVQAAPAVRVAQMVREQQAVVRERERLEQELRVARLIQQTLLPRICQHSQVGSWPPIINQRTQSVATFMIFSYLKMASWVLSLGMYPIKVCQRQWSWQARVVFCAPQPTG